MPRRRSRTVWFLTVQGSEMLDVAGPWEVFGHANDVLGHEAYALELVSAHAEVRTRHGLALRRTRALPSRSTALPQIVVVPGGSPHRAVAGPDQALLAWLRKHHARLSALVSICTGAFVLGEAGLLDGRRATTHWAFLSELAARFPRAEVVDAGIFVRDGKLWTSAGITAGIDLALALVEQHHGHDVAIAVAKQMVLFLRRSGTQAQFSSSLLRQAKEPAGSRDLSVYVLENLQEPLPVAALAKAAGMSVRSLSRFCRAHLDESPAQMVRRLRLEEARRLLEETELPLKDICARTRLGAPSTLWRAFTQRYSVTPAQYRARFSRPTPE